ncbi:hypothetical protein GCM10023339_77020 [Alloalcanivorax gelatiniphagus]
MSEPGDAPDVGSLGEEAAKLLGALSGWAREHAGGLGEGIDEATSQAAAQVHDLDEHLATGSAECTVCPVCRAVHAVRQLSPEVTDHLASAFTSLAQAAAAVMATTGPRAADEDAGADARTDAGADDGTVEHIDVGADWPEDG